MDQRAPLCRRRRDFPDRVLRCAGRSWASWCPPCRCCSRSARWSGLGHVNGPYALVCATLGAFVGDALSFWIGRRWGAQLRSRWPFSRYPQWLDRGESMFRRNGMQEHLHRALRRRGAAVRAGDRGHAAHAAAALRARQPVRLRDLGRRRSSRRAGCWARPTTRSPRSPTGWRWCWRALVVAIALVWACVLYTWRWFAGACRQPAGARAALDARASAPGPLRRGADRSQPARIAVAGDARGMPAGDQLGLVHAAGVAAGAAAGRWRSTTASTMRCGACATRSPIA